MRRMRKSSTMIGGIKQQAGVLNYRQILTETANLLDQSTTIHQRCSRRPNMGGTSNLRIFCERRKIDGLGGVIHCCTAIVAELLPIADHDVRARLFGRFEARLQRTRKQDVV